MTQRLFVAILTVAVFLAGYGARGWTEPHQSVPPAPAVLTKEYVPDKGPGADKKKEKSDQKLDRAKLVAEIQKLKPQIDVYTTQAQEIDAEFDREFTQVLTAEQREKYNTNRKKRQERDAKRMAERTPLSDEDIQSAKDRPLTWIYWQVTVTPMLETLTKEYKLDDTQQASTRALLALRRNKFMALYDSTPHPSIRLSRLAPLIERVSQPLK